MLHTDNGGSQKGSTRRATLESLGIVASYSRPRVSDDNAFSEVLFRTFKYRPDYPQGCFEILEAARDWSLAFCWYNQEYRHSAIRYVTPAVRHAGRDPAILVARKEVYQAARDRHPARWSQATRNWEPLEEVWLNSLRIPAVAAEPGLTTA